MKWNSNERRRWVLTVLLTATVLAMWAGVGLVTAQESTANPVRTLPSVVAPGDEFDVTVNFTSPADAFFAVNLADEVPDGWLVTLDPQWCVPLPNYCAPTDPWQPGPATYVWDGPYDQGVSFTALYRVRVPLDAAPGTYNFTGTLNYTIGQPPGTYEQSGGDLQVTINEMEDNTRVALSARTASQLGCMSLVKSFDAPDGVDFPASEVQVRVTGDGFDQTYWLTAAEGWEKTICDLLVGNYTVEELTAEPGWTVSYEPASRVLQVVVGDVPGPGATLNITNTYNIIGISVTPTEIDFGEISAGATIVDSPGITVINTGNVNIHVSAELESDTYCADQSYFYTQALKLNDVFSDRHGTPAELGKWTPEDLALHNVSPAQSQGVSTALVCPGEMYGGTEYAATLVFWAVASDV